MLRSLTERLRRVRPPAAEPDPESGACVPDGLLVCAIGDIHGRLDLLHELEALLVRHAETRPETRRLIVCLGDYVDRGYQSRELIDHLLAAPPAGFERICLLGNHEEFLLRFIESPADGPVWLANGGRETLMSYGVTLPSGTASDDDIARARADFLTALRARHLGFLRALEPYHVEGDYLFVHAGIRPGRPLAGQQTGDLLWIREPFLNSGADHGHIVVHGHTVWSYTRKLVTA